MLSYSKVASRPATPSSCKGPAACRSSALQFARLLGARVIATSSSNDKLARVRQMGASDGINYKETPDWEDRVRELTGGAGVDHVVEVGGAGTFNKSLKAVSHRRDASTSSGVLQDRHRQHHADPHEERPRARNPRRQPRDVRGDEPRDCAAPAPSGRRSGLPFRRGFAKRSNIWKAVRTSARCACTHNLAASRAA